MKLFTYAAALALLAGSYFFDGTSRAEATDSQVDPALYEQKLDEQLRRTMRRLSEKTAHAQASPATRGTEISLASR